MLDALIGSNLATFAAGFALAGSGAFWLWSRRKTPLPRVPEAKMPSPIPPKQVTPEALPKLTEEPKTCEPSKPSEFNRTKPAVDGALGAYAAAASSLGDLDVSRLPVGNWRTTELSDLAPGADDPLRLEDLEGLRRACTGVATLSRKQITQLRGAIAKMALPDALSLLHDLDPMLQQSVLDRLELHPAVRVRLEQELIQRRH